MHPTEPGDTSPDPPTSARDFQHSLRGMSNATSLLRYISHRPPKIAAASKVPPALEMSSDLWTCTFVDGDPMPSACCERTRRTHRQFDHAALLPSPFRKLGHRCLQVSDPIDEHWPSTPQVARQQQLWGTFGQLDHGHPGTHFLDCEEDPCAERHLEVCDLRSYIGARRVDVIKSSKW